jgi:hypothetical protein
MQANAKKAKNAKESESASGSESESEVRWLVLALALTSARALSECGVRAFATLTTLFRRYPPERVFLQQELTVEVRRSVTCGRS